MFRKTGPYKSATYLYINLRRSRDCLCVSVAASFTYFGEVLRCPHKRIVTITKVYIARNTIHAEIIQISGFSYI